MTEREADVRLDDPAIDEELAHKHAAAHDAAGVDLTQIDWMLSLTPRERLAALLVHTRSMQRLMGNARRD